MAFGGYPEWSECRIKWWYWSKISKRLNWKEQDSSGHQGIRASIAISCHFSSQGSVHGLRPWCRSGCRAWVWIAGYRCWWEPSVATAPWVTIGKFKSAAKWAQMARQQSLFRFLRTACSRARIVKPSQTNRKAWSTSWSLWSLCHSVSEGAVAV